MNISFSEILLVLLIAVVVIKPDQLPEVAFTFGKIIKSIRGFFAKCKDEMNGFIQSIEKPNEQKPE